MNVYEKLLIEELIPAMGCTEPVTVAYCAAKAAEVLGERPGKLTAECSGNIIKNVKGVVVPGTGGMKGIETAAVAGAFFGDPAKELEVLDSLTKENVCSLKEIADRRVCSVKLSDSEERLFVRVTAEKEGQSAAVTISGGHKEIIEIRKNGEVVFKKECVSAEESDDNCREIDLEGIFTFADEGDLSAVRPVLERQIECNMAAAEEGLRNAYGAQIGRIFSRKNCDDVWNTIKSYTAAGSDARMGGCELPVVINSGSGNQGITVSVPLVIYAGSVGADDEVLMRALTLSNLISIYIKRGIGRLSAFCGAVSAACGAASGICYMRDGSFDGVSRTIINVLANTSGIVCDGAKASCAAKIASSLDSAELAVDMACEGICFSDGDGIVDGGAEGVIRNVWRLGRDGMKNTDTEILHMMTE